MTDAVMDDTMETLDNDIRRTGPGTLAGRYLRCFWMPIYHASDLPTGAAVPLRIMSQDFTLYRGESGKPYLIGGRCAHRGTRLSTGWIQGEQIRCFFHGWKFDGKGQCVEQPAEDSRFADRVNIGGYPVREYLGMFFAYLGEGEPPEFPRYKEFEFFDGLVELDSYLRECNYLQNLENALDMSHVGFVHSDNEGSFDGIGHGKRLKAEESDWGVRYSFLRPDGQERVQQFGMPNIFHPMALPIDPEVGWLESMFWWTPIDDQRHMQFTIHRVPVTGEVAKRVEARKEARRSQIDLAHQDVADDVIDGRIRLADVDQSRVDLVRLQDDIAQVGQGRFGSASEKLGRSDVGVVAIRRLWQREMAKMQAGEPLKQWHHSPSTMPAVWAVPELARAGEEAAPSKISDIRPFIEIKLQLRALHGELRVR